MSQDLESSIALGTHLVHVQGVVMHLRQATHIITYGRPLVVVVVVEVVVYCLKVFKYMTVTYLIIVIFFTLTKFLENKIYTQKRQFFALNL